MASALDERTELITQLEAYRNTYSTSYDTGYAMDLLIKNLKAEEDDEKP